ASAGGQAANEQNIVVGANHGRAYGPGLEAPSFIAPPSEPLLASMKLQDRLEEQVRKMVNLAVQATASRESAESKSLDNQGLEAGLSFIGLCLQNAEQQIASHWAAYEDRNPKNRSVAVVKYPDRYSLKTDADRIRECGELTKLLYSVPGRLAKKE